MRLRFGTSVFDSDLRELARGGKRVALTPKAFALLEVLVQARPQPVSREALSELLWPATFVEQGNLHNLISEIRHALQDDAHETIRTVHRFGYAFEAAGTVEETALYVIDLDRDEILLRGGENMIGRDPSDAICIAAPDVSRHHARLTVDGETVTLEDLGSKNGTFLGTTRIQSPVVLKEGDEILIGRTRLRFRAKNCLPSTKTAW